MRTLLTLHCLIVLGCAGAIPQNRELAFTYAVDQLQAGRAAAANAAWSYLQGAIRRTHAMTALSAYSHGPHKTSATYASAQWFLDIAQGRRDPELSEAIRGLQTIIESGAFDEDALVDGYLLRPKLSACLSCKPSSATTRAFAARLFEKRWSRTTLLPLRLAVPIGPMLCTSAPSWFPNATSKARLKSSASSRA